MEATAAEVIAATQRRHSTQDQLTELMQGLRAAATLAEDVNKVSLGKAASSSSGSASSSS